MSDILFPFFVVAAAVIAAPQPRHSEGLIVIYGNQYLVEANADWHGYDLSHYPARCGFSAISPAMLGRIAWIRTPGHDWVGPCISVDAVGANDALDSIYGRHEIAEITWDMASQLGFDNGGRWGEIYFGACPPDVRDRHMQPEPYAPPRDITQWPYRWSSFYPYPQQEMPRDICD